MKKILLLFIVIFVAGCGSQNEKNNTEPEQNSKEEAETNSTESTVSVKFRNIDITSPNDQIVVKGDAVATNNFFYFTLKYGEKVMIEETKVELDTDASDWGSFQLDIELPKSEETKEQIPVLNFYVKNAEGEIINPNYIPVDVGK